MLSIIVLFNGTRFLIDSSFFFDFYIAILSSIHSLDFHLFVLLLLLLL